MKTLHIPGDTPLVHTPRSTGSGDLCNDPTDPTTLEGVLPMLWTNAERSFYLNLGNDRRNVVSLISPIEGGKSHLVVLGFVGRGRDRYGRLPVSTTNVLPCAHEITSKRCFPFTGSPRSSSGVGGWSRLRGWIRPPQCRCSGENCVLYVGPRPETFR